MRALVVDPHRPLAKRLAMAMEIDKLTTTFVVTPREALERVSSTKYNVIVMELLQEEMDGISLIRRFREQKIDSCIMVLTFRDSLTDKVAALDSGADDYMTKPFELEELLARIRALIRRDSYHKRAIIPIHDIVLDTRRKDVTRGNKKIVLSEMQYAIMELLIMNVGRHFSNIEIWDSIFKNRDYDDQYLRRGMSKLTQLINTGPIKIMRNRYGLGMGMITEEQYAQELAELGISEEK